MHILKIALASLLTVGTLVSGVKASTTQADVMTASPSARQQDFADMLARAELAKRGVTPKNTAKADYQIALIATTRDIQAQRSAGLGWGAIANKAGLNWGKVVSAAEHKKQKTRSSAGQQTRTREQKNRAHSKSGSPGDRGGGAGHATGSRGGNR